MFSGIIETIGIISHLQNLQSCLELTISPVMIFDDLKVGDSVAVNGVCLTVTSFTTESFKVVAVPETLRLTNLGELASGREVNLERSLKVGSRNGGHNVQGHVDFCAEVLALTMDGEQALMAEFSCLPTHRKYIVNKGYVTIDGMSITVIDVKPASFTVTFIPHTQQVTNVKHYQVGTRINIEVDIMGKYLERYLENYRGSLIHDAS